MGARNNRYCRILYEKGNSRKLTPDTARVSGVSFSSPVFVSRCALSSIALPSLLSPSLNSRACSPWLRPVFDLLHPERQMVACCCVALSCYHPRNRLWLPPQGLHPGQSHLNFGRFPPVFLRNRGLLTVISWPNLLRPAPCSGDIGGAGHDEKGGGYDSTVRCTTDRRRDGGTDLDAIALGLHQLVYASLRGS